MPSWMSGSGPLVWATLQEGMRYCTVQLIALEVCGRRMRVASHNPRPRGNRWKIQRFERVMRKSPESEVQVKFGEHFLPIFVL